ncbi:STAS domain-containing protein [Pseudomonas sp. LJDD11]|uniref:STAS domain-containing protein n=1 Tax=unclassified Pseudomonas TaxID=196821 RepID=UPI002098461F|nr:MULTISPECIES: STAS domain-containing protein [unclassified Pseudomonas]MCO8165608.1 STAS domain-containing protein [Pseudomonas sp. 21LCFQ010]MCQ9423688.1 STAS domain-containing protein [Pseudomonas sp. LJDD11]
MCDVDRLFQRIVIKEGDLTMITAVAQQQLLLDLIPMAREIEIDLCDVVEIDAAGVQVLITAKIESNRLGRHLLLSNASEVMINMLETRGLSRLLKTDA